MGYFYRGFLIGDSNRGIFYKVINIGVFFSEIIIGGINRGGGGVIGELFYKGM